MFGEKEIEQVIGLALGLPTAVRTDLLGMSDQDAAHFHRQCKRWARNRNICSVKSGIKEVNGTPTGEPVIQVTVDRKITPRSSLSRPVPYVVRHSALQYDIRTDVIELDDLYGDGFVRPGSRIVSNGNEGYGKVTGFYPSSGYWICLTAGHVLFGNGTQLYEDPVFHLYSGNVLGYPEEIDFGQHRETLIDAGTIAVESGAQFNTTDGLWSGYVRDETTISPGEKMFAYSESGRKRLKLGDPDRALNDRGLTSDLGGSSVTVFGFYGVVALPGSDQGWRLGDSGTCVYDLAGNACFLIFMANLNETRFAWGLPLRRVLERFGIDFTLVG
ncbi:MAG: hypothetical protein AAF098_15925 [Pseudomonadota bacterium]